jgi:hypothetical protein
MLQTSTIGANFGYVWESPPDQSHSCDVDAGFELTNQMNAPPLMYLRSYNMMFFIPTEGCSVARYRVIPLKLVINLLKSTIHVRRIWDLVKKINSLWPGVKKKSADLGLKKIIVVN